MSRRGGSRTCPCYNSVLFFYVQDQDGKSPSSFRRRGRQIQALSTSICKPTDNSSFGSLAGRMGKGGGREQIERQRRPRPGKPKKPVFLLSLPSPLHLSKFSGGWSRKRKQVSLLLSCVRMNWKKGTEGDGVHGGSFSD